jgi:23S rRNA pseudouridine1911/1915/1917 synthase
VSFTARLAAPARLVDVVKAHLVVVPVGEIGGLITRGAIRIAGHVGKLADIGKMAELVRDGDILTADAAAIAPIALPPEDGALEIRYEDDDLLVCDKPAGLHVHPIGPYRDGTLLNRLLWHVGARPDNPWGTARPSPLHRLDRAASGLVAIAKSATIHDAVRRLFVGHEMERRYAALVIGRVRDDAGTIDAPLGRDPRLDYRRAIVPLEHGGQRAVTHWTVAERRADHTRLEVTLETGRTHQIRAHLASIGHPIAGDSLYAEGTDSAPEIALHATRLRFRHPRTGVEIVVASPLPTRFA